MQHERSRQLRRQCNGTSFFGMLKRERVNRRQYLTRAEAREDVFDYIEQFHNPRKRQQLGMRQQKKLFLNSIFHGNWVKSVCLGSR